MPKVETNYNLVRRWMADIGQAVPDFVTVPDYDTVKLRQELVREEAKEAFDEFAALAKAIRTDKPSSKEELPALIKELADILVVVYGSFAAIGVDADEVMKIVMENNFGKIEEGTFRNDGKLVVPKEVKKALKEAATQKLLALLR